jgi:membrane associated rhomboid family serine protease
VVFWLIGINVLIFAAMQLLGDRLYGIVMIAGYLFRMDMFTYYFSMIPDKIINDSRIWTFVTYMFLHGDLRHILFNMLGLFIFGMHVEKQMGSREFLLFYFLTGTLAGIFSFIVYYMTGNFIVALIGASGALYAVMLAYAVFFPDSIIYIWGILPLRAPVMVLGFTALELFFSVRGGRGNVAHLTHLAGFGFGWFYFLIRFGMNPWRRLTGR